MYGTVYCKGNSFKIQPDGKKNSAVDYGGLSNPRTNPMFQSSQVTAAA